MKSILVVTDHFTCYAQCYVTKNQTALTVETELVNKYSPLMDGQTKF